MHNTASEADLSWYSSDFQAIAMRFEVYEVLRTRDPRWRMHRTRFIDTHMLVRAAR